jgi:hypothetical protein
LFASDAEEFMALEQIAKAEAELKDFMVYYGTGWIVGRLYCVSS